MLEDHDPEVLSGKSQGVYLIEIDVPGHEVMEDSLERPFPEGLDQEVE